ncbi:MAG: hypothetical protein IH840_17895, partial [Candidatus Heimdallarchaeota archaeon]|nr:hypothetical protein [Candidatus Heimdallarchaeota archaeon]
MSRLKEIRIEIPNNQYDVITDFLGSSNLKYAEVKLASNGTLFILKVEDNVSNELLHELKARGVGEVFGNISLIHLGLYIDSSSDNVTLKKSEAANIEEILANIEDSAVVSFTYVTLVLLSGALAAFGLLSESIVIIIG